MKPFGDRLGNTFPPAARKRAKPTSVAEMLGFVLDPQPYPALPPIYQPVQLNTGVKGGALETSVGLSESAASAAPANSNAAATKPSTFVMQTSAAVTNSQQSRVAGNTGAIA